MQYVQPYRNHLIVNLPTESVSKYHFTFFATNRKPSIPSIVSAAAAIGG